MENDSIYVTANPFIAEESLYYQLCKFSKPIKKIKLKGSTKPLSTRFTLTNYYT